MPPLKKVKRRQLAAEVGENVDLAPMHPGYFRLTIASPWLAREARPGQFIHVLPPGSGEMLRRPFSVLGADPARGTVTILFRAIGEGTFVLSQVRAGNKLDIIGPLGNGFPLDVGHSAALVGGGVGIPPLVLLAEKLIASGMSTDPSESEHISVFLGARDAATLVCIDDFRAMGVDPVLSTEDGSLGVEGLVTDALDREGEFQRGCLVYSCGPLPMLRAMAEWTRRRGLECFVSLENKLGCGIGACLGCSVPVRDDCGLRYQRVCCDGPVFDASRVAFDRM